MKIIFLILTMISNISFAQIISLEIAVETRGIRVEYSDVSQRGFIYPIKCDSCTKKAYEFKGPIKVKKKNQPISFTAFLSDYSNAKYPTLFLNPETLDVLRVSY